MGKDEFKIPRKTAQFSITLRDNTSTTFDSSRPKDELRRQIIEAVNRDVAEHAQRDNTAAAEKQTKEADQTAAEVLKAVADKIAAEADRLQRALIILFAPPTVLLVFGAGIACVARGFRRPVTWKRKARTSI